MDACSLVDAVEKSTGLSRELLEQSGGRFARNKWDEDDFAAGLLDRAAFGLVERLEGVIATFGVDVGLGGGQKIGGADVRENADRIDGFQRSENGRAIEFVVHGPPFAFESTDGSIAVHADEEHVTMVAGILKVSNVAEMKKVKAAVRDDEALLGAELRAPCGEVGIGDDFGAKVQCAFFDRSGRKVEGEM